MSPSDLFLDLWDVAFGAVSTVRAPECPEWPVLEGRLRRGDGPDAMMAATHIRAGVDYRDRGEPDAAHAHFRAAFAYAAPSPDACLQIGAERRPSCAVQSMPVSPHRRSSSTSPTQSGARAGRTMRSASSIGRPNPCPMTGRLQKPPLCSKCCTAAWPTPTTAPSPSLTGNRRSTRLVRAPSER